MTDSECRHFMLKEAEAAREPEQVKQAAAAGYVRVRKEQQQQQSQPSVTHSNSLFL